MWLSLLSVWLEVCEELSGVYKGEAACKLGQGCWGGEGVAHCQLGDLSAPSFFFPLKPEAGETFSVVFGNIFSLSCFPSETEMGKVSHPKWGLC